MAVQTKLHTLRYATRKIQEANIPNCRTAMNGATKRMFFKGGSLLKNMLARCEKYNFPDA